MQLPNRLEPELLKIKEALQIFIEYLLAFLFCISLKGECIRTLLAHKASNLFEQPRIKLELTDHGMTNKVSSWLQTKKYEGCCMNSDKTNMTDDWSTNDHKEATMVFPQFLVPYAPFPLSVFMNVNISNGNLNCINLWFRLYFSVSTTSFC